MNEVTTIGLDIAKNVFHAHGADASGQALFSRKIGRTKLLDFFAAQPRCTVALEALGKVRFQEGALKAGTAAIKVASCRPARRPARMATMGWFPDRQLLGDGSAKADVGSDKRIRP